MLTGLWFVTNMVFVASLIAYLFAQRSHREALAAGSAADHDRLRRRKRLTGILAVASGVATTGILVANMLIKG